MKPLPVVELSDHPTDIKTMALHDIHYAAKLLFADQDPYFSDKLANTVAAIANDMSHLLAAARRQGRRDIALVRLARLQSRRRGHAG
mgnify:CR=1 FL=1